MRRNIAHENPRRKDHIDGVIGKNRPEAFRIQGVVGHDGGGHVDRIARGAVGRNGGRNRPAAGLRELRNRKAELLAAVGHLHPRSAGIGQNGDVSSLRRPAALEDLRKGRQIPQLVNAENARLAEEGVVNPVVAGQRSRVGLGRPRAGRRPADFLDQHRLSRDQRGLGRPAEFQAVLCAFEIDADEIDVLVSDQMGDEIRKLQIRLVAHADERIHADAVLGSLDKSLFAERAALRDEGQFAGVSAVDEHDVRKRSHDRLRIVNQPQTVRPQNAQAALPGDVGDPVLQGPARFACFGKSRREDDGCFHAGRGARAKRVERPLDGHGNNGQIDGFGNIAD